MMLNVDNEKCSGCCACAEICPKNCIQMERDDEGFLYPVLLLSENECINCGLCEKACPLSKRKPDEKHVEKGYIVQNKDEGIRRQSTSGGAFTAIAETIIGHNGIVYGATYGENFRVTHVGVTENEELWRFRNSKYVQSDTRGIFPEIKNYLIDGRTICFSGTPCQVEGLLGYLQRDYDNLTTVDVVCHGVSSPLIWEKYLDYMQDTDPEWIYFRDKHYGYKYSTMTFIRNGKEIYSEGVETDPMLRAYFTNNCDRKSCYQCAFKKRYRTSDITIWDCYQPEFFNKTFGDDRGTTSLLANSHKGVQLFDEIRRSGKVKYLEVDPEELTRGNKEMVCSVTKGGMRADLLIEASKTESALFFERNFSITYKTKFKKAMRLLLIKLGIYNKIKYLLFKHRRKKTA